MRYSNHKKKTCDNIIDFYPDTYGCCEIVDENNLRYNISYVIVLKEDEEGSNCPSYHHILELSKNYFEEYDSYYGGNFAKSGEKKCVKSGVIFPFKDCPSTKYIISLYNNFFRSPWEKLYFFIISCIIVFCIVINCKE